MRSGGALAEVMNAVLNHVCVRVKDQCVNLESPPPPHTHYKKSVNLSLQVDTVFIASRFFLLLSSTRLEFSLFLRQQ